jgi:assimilatory nitrate reductase catalytic subunit
MRATWCLGGLLFLPERFQLDVRDHGNEIHLRLLWRRCGVIIEHDATRITGVRGDPEHPANFGRLCTKGNTLHLTVTPQALAQRLTHPQLRRDKARCASRSVGTTALDYAADRFAQAIAEHGPDSVAFYISGQLLTEDYYVFNKLAKG